MGQESDNQGTLFDSGDLRSTVAARTFVHFANSYIKAAYARTGQGPQPRALDEISFACVLLCMEFGFSLKHSAPAKIEECRIAASQSRHGADLDMLPWRVCEALLSDSPYVAGILVRDLTHGSSSIRGYILELAWLTRNRLPAHDLLPGLLKNAADTLMYVDWSLGMAMNLCSSPDEFWRIADAFVPPDGDFEDQYRSRLAAMRSVDGFAYTAGLVQMENGLRSDIMRFALSLQSAR